MTNRPAAKRERVDDLIDRVERKHPHIGKVGLASFFEAVHQELAPLARALEQENDELRAQIQGVWRLAGRQNQKERAATRHTYACPDCGATYVAGTMPVKVFADHGQVFCRVCNPEAYYRKDQSPMTRTEERMGDAD